MTGRRPGPAPSRRREGPPTLPGAQRVPSPAGNGASGEKGEGAMPSPRESRPLTRIDPTAPHGRSGGAPTTDDAAEAAATPAATDPAVLARLLAWMSPAFPVGAYSHSHGLEWAVADGTVNDAASLEAWLADIVRHGTGRSDAILFAHAWRAAAGGDHAALAAVAELAAALQPSKERHIEATAQGRAFLAAVAAAWPNDRLTALAATLARRPLAHAVAVAVAAAAHEVPLAPALSAALAAFAANLVSAGVRAIPIGHSDGQRTIAALAPIVAEVAAAAATASLDDLGGAALRADIASMKHETQYSRLFRS